MRSDMEGIASKQPRVTNALARYWPSHPFDGVRSTRSRSSTAASSHPGPPPGPAEQELPLLGNLQVAIDGSSRLVIALGGPQAGNRNDIIVYAPVRPGTVGS